MSARASAPPCRAELARDLGRSPALAGAVPVNPVPRLKAAAALASYARYWVDTFRVPSLSLDQLDRGLSFTGREHLEAGLAAGRGVVLALPHLGGWELAGAYIARMGDPITVVVEALQPPEAFRWFTDLRRAMGMTVVAADAHAGAAVARALAANHVVCLLCDRDLAGTGIPVDFFDERTTLPGGPATSVHPASPATPTAGLRADGMTPPPPPPSP